MLPLATRCGPPPGSRRSLGFLLLLLLSLVACRGPDVREDLSQAGFRTPERTFKTFRAAFLSDLPTLEYRCFSSAFTTRNGMSQLAYREAREQGLSEQPFLRWGLGRAEIVQVKPLGPTRARLYARSKSLIHEVVFAITFLREDFYELWDGERRVQDDFLPFEETVFLQEDELGVPYVTAYVPMRDPSKFGSLVEVRFGREWKIDDLKEIPVEELPASEPAPQESID